MKCTCGHLETEHGEDGTHWICYAKIVKGNNREFCDCEEFQPVEGARLV